MLQVERSPSRASSRGDTHPAVSSVSSPGFLDTLCPRRWGLLKMSAKPKAPDGG